MVSSSCLQGEQDTSSPSEEIGLSHPAQMEPSSLPPLPLGGLAQ